MYLLERDRCLGEQATVRSRPCLQGDGSFAKYDTLNVRARGGVDGATDDPDDVARERAARESHPFAGGDGEGASYLEDPGFEESSSVSRLDGKW
jgi:hypothetical protein